jgi:hypothetical protein
LTENEILEGKELFYTIEFQNTGNYPADRVRITDQIDTALYLSSIRLVAASHPVSLFELIAGGLLHVSFDNIYLPDSISNEPGSHGFITFAIRRKHTFNRTVAVLNRAEIFFDFNDPVITNEVSFKIRDDNPTAISTVSESPPKLVVYPNPSTGTIFVVLPASQSEYDRLTVYDINGKQRFIKLNPVTNSKTIEVDLASLPNGMYILSLQGSDGELAGRVLLHE